MPRNEPKPAVVLAAVLASEPGAHSIGYHAAADAEALIRLGKRALRIAEQRCNGIPRWNASARQVLNDWTESDESRADKAIAKIEAEAAKILAGYGADNIKAHGDPRGYVLTFRLASKRTNSIAGEWGV